MARPLSARKRDIVYLIFFCIHIPVMLGVDLVPLYPAALQTSWMMNLRKWYITTYRDQFFVEPPAWFTLYAYLEALYHLPLSFWAIGALFRGDPKLPIHLLVYAVQTAVTTMTCISDFLSWKTVSGEEKMGLAGLYVPYLALAVFMGVDMFGRLDEVLGKRTAAGAGKKST